MKTQTLYMHLVDESHTLRIPLIYFEDRFNRVDRQVYEGQLLRVMNGAFSPVTRPKAEDPKRHPSCNHDFRAHGIDVRASYRAPYLKDWARIQTDISDFIGCALDNPT